MELQIIRTRHPPDTYLDQMAVLNGEAGYSTTSEEIKRRILALPDGDRLILALDSDVLIGYAHLRVAHDLLTEETAELVSIIVRETHRRLGIGRRLVTAAETWATQSGKARLLLHTDVVRTDAHAFFIALGYEETSTSVDFVRDLNISRRADAPTQPR